MCIRDSVWTEEITYTLPEDPKEARKDFDVIDNRKGKAGLEYEFDGIGARKGEGNYYVENNKTGSQVTATTRKEAEFLAKNPKEWAYGEGESIITRTETAVETPSETDITQEDFVELKILADPDVSVKNKNNAFNKVVGRLTKKGKTLTRTAAALIKKVKTLDVNDPVGVKNVLDKINKVFTDADTKQKIDKAKSLQLSLIHI